MTKHDRRNMPQSEADSLNIMLSAAGRRVALMRLLEASLSELAIGGTVVASDITLASPAMQLAAQRIVVPPYGDANCLSFLLALCRKHRIRLIVPTIDPELEFYATHARLFAEIGCHINISSVQTAEIGRDKRRTHQWLAAGGFPTVDQWTIAEAIELAGRGGLRFPVIVKPRYGSASTGMTVAANAGQLGGRAGEAELLVQSIAPGREYTVDVFIDGTGRCRCAVPRLRLEVRGGEVSKGMTVRNAAVADLARRIAEALPGARGVLNVQIFHDETTDRMAAIEINPRFGGGYPLSHEAGAAMTRWLLEDILQLPSSARDDLWREGVVMLRYDEAVFCDRAAAHVAWGAAERHAP